MILKEYSKELKPCPFCGKNANVEKDEGLFGNKYLFVRCACCGTRTSEKYANLEYCAVEEVIRAWNKRPEGEPK